VRWSLALISLFAVAGCGNNFNPMSYVVGLRVLAVKAEPPELRPGEAAQLSALVVSELDPLDASLTPTSYRWAICNLISPPNNSTQVNNDCLTDAGVPYLTDLGGAPTATVTMPANAAVSMPDSTLGVYLPIRLIVDGPTADESDTPGEIISFYRLRDHDPAILKALSLLPLNHNPTLTAIEQVPKGWVDDMALPDGGAPGVGPTPLDDAAPPVVHEHDQIILRATFTADSAEKIPIIDPNNPTMPMFGDESLRVSWFTSAGSFSDEVTGLALPDTTLTLDDHLPAGDGTVTVWAVAADGRGGVDWIARTLRFSRGSDDGGP
jgi:hypothetical protein